ncbi:MAG TPA: hypothetical protein VF792_01045 [Ktedonobacterales bacterium]
MADTNTSSNAPTNGAAPSKAGGQTLLGLFRRRNGRAGALSGTSRFILGSVIFIFTAELLTYGLDYLNIQYKLGLMQPIAKGAGWLTWFLILNVVIILGVWLLLRRVGLLPTDMFNVQRNAAARNAQTTGRSATSSNGSKQPAAQIPGIGKARTRAERRYAANVAAAEAEAAAAKAKSKRATTTAQPAATTQVVENDEHDEAYDRVKAAQRMRKRRALR